MLKGKVFVFLHWKSETNNLSLWFSNFSLPENHLQSLLKLSFWFSRSGVSSSKFAFLPSPGITDSVDSRDLIRELLVRSDALQRYVQGLLEILCWYILSFAILPSTLNYASLTRDSTSNIMYYHVISISHLLYIVASVLGPNGHSVGKFLPL